MKVVLYIFFNNIYIYDLISDLFGIDCMMQNWLKLDFIKGLSMVGILEFSSRLFW